MSYNDSNDGGFGPRHFDQLTTANLFSARDTLRDANQRIREFEENNQGDIRDTSMRDIQAFEAATGPMLSWYERDGDTVNCALSTKNFAFMGQMMVLCMTVMERYCDSMANTRDIASRLESMVNLLTHEVDENGDSDYHIFSSMIDNGQKENLVEIVCDALASTTELNVFNQLVDQAAGMALLSTSSDQHHTQRQVIDMTMGNIMERAASKMMADMQAQLQKVRAIQNAPAGSQPTGQPKRAMPTWLSVVEGKKED